MQQIPRMVVQTHHECPTEESPLFQAIHSVRKHNPNYEYRFFNDQECRQFIAKHYPAQVVDAYDELYPGFLKSELFRYCYLLQNGGCYIDCNMKALGSLDDLIGPDDSLIVCRGLPEDNSLETSIILCRPQHPAIQEMVDTCVRNITQWKHVFSALSMVKTTEKMFDITGTALFHIVCQPFLDDRNKIGLRVDGSGNYMDMNGKEFFQTLTPRYSAYSKCWNQQMLFYQHVQQIGNTKLLIAPTPNRASLLAFAFDKEGHIALAIPYQLGVAIDVTTSSVLPLDVS